MNLTLKTARYLFWISYILFPWIKATAQNERLYVIEPLPLEVSADKTVSINFPAAVKTVDRGSADLLAQKVKGTENVVLVKAARKDIQPTSLIVITGDGEIHTFEVQYQQRPTCIGMQIMPRQSLPLSAQISETIDQKQINEGINLATGKEPNLNRKASTNNFSVTVDGLYVAGPVIYIRLSLENRSLIDYDIEMLRLFTGDKKQIKRSASQQDELRIIDRSAQIDQIKTSEQRSLVLAIAKLTIPKNKRLSISIGETNGARNLTITLKNRHLNRITAL